MVNSPAEVPVALFVFNRHKDLQRTLDCLRSAGIKLLYVFADGSRGEQDDEGVAKVREIVRGIKWTTSILIEQTANIGLSESIQQGVDLVLKEHESVIVIEDDICVAPGFYEYMKQTLSQYEHDDRIVGVTGLRYPFNKRHLSNDRYDVFLSPRFCSWGWATWRKKWQKLSFDEQTLIKKIEAQGLDTSIGGMDLPNAIEQIKHGTLSGCWDVVFYMNMVLNKSYFVWPKRNYVINTGLTEGEHATGSPPPAWELKWEVKRKNRTLTLPNQPTINDKILGDFLEFFRPQNLNKDTSTQTMKNVARKIKHSIKSTLRGKSEPVPVKPDPKDYSTTDDPLEVPCQKEVYYHVLNNLIKPGNTVLDVGIGLGYGMAILSVQAGRVEGVDVDKKAVDHATTEYLGKNPKIKSIKVYDGYKLPYKANSFDVVTCVDVLEHVEDYDRFIDELLRVSKKYVVFGTPNRRPEYTNPDGTPMNYWHLREWSKPELDAILKKHSVKIQWNLIDGPFDGPFTVNKRAGKNTLVLMPVLTKQ